MRTPAQLEMRRGRAKLANDFMAWLVQRQQLLDSVKDTAGRRPGRLPRPKGHSSTIVVEAYYREKGTDKFEVWRAWDILKEAHRLDTMKGGGWELVNQKPIEVTQVGDVF